MMMKASLAAAMLFAAVPAAAQTAAPPTYAPPPATAPAPSTAGAQGQSSTAQPSSPGASSQQVVVNPPQAGQPAATAPAPSTSTTVVNPSPTYVRDDVVLERRERNPMRTVATDAAYGGVAGLLVGLGVALINEWDTWERDTMVGAGLGLVLGAGVGVVHASYEARDERRARLAFDGLNRTDRDPVVTARTVSFGFRF